MFSYEFPLTNLFVDELFRSHKHRSLASGMEEEDVYTLDHNLTLKVVKRLITVMLHWNSFRDEIIRFVDYIFAQTKTPEEFSSKLQNKMATDSFWDTAANAKMKDGVWKPKKVKAGSRIRRKKKGSRISTLERRNTPSAGKIETPKKDTESKAPKEQQVVSPRNRMKDRISQWEGQ